MDLSAFTKAGLRQAEIGKLVGVSHNTAGMWMRGKRDPHFLLESKVRPVIEAVQKAVDNDELPLESTVPRNDRMGKIEDIVKKHLC